MIIFLNNMKNNESLQRCERSELILHPLSSPSLYVSSTQYHLSPPSAEIATESSNQVVWKNVQR